MRLHNLAIPHTVTSKEYLCCAFTQKVLKFCQMMKKVGYHIIHYGNEESEVDCNEHVTVTSKETLETAYPGLDWRKDFFQHPIGDHASKTFTENAVREVKARAQKGDAVLFHWGFGHKAIADQLDGDQLAFIEPGIGYPTAFAPFRAYESYAHLHQDLGKNQLMPPWYHVVIPNYFDPDDFEFSDKKGDYFLFLGRIITQKGVDIAIDITQEIDERLIIAGQGDILKELGRSEIPSHVEHIGFADVGRRRELLRDAKAVFMPTYYIEPFGGVMIEAFFSGTPVISTDWGTFAENNIHGITGYRCRTMEHFKWAAENIGDISPEDCRIWAQNFTMDRVGLMFDEFFQSVKSVMDGGGLYMSNPQRSNLNWLYKGITVKSLNDHIDIEAEYEKRLTGDYVEEGHLGGYIRGGDSQTWEPVLWQYVIDRFKIQSIADVGCGEGHSAKWFDEHGMQVLAFDGSQAAIQTGVYPIVGHDFTKSPLMIGPVDLVYACEFVEHVEQQYLENVLSAFCSGKYVLMTYAAPGQAGYHHVNCQDASYWVDKLQALGFTYEKEVTKEIRSYAEKSHFKERGLFFRKD